MATKRTSSYQRRGKKRRKIAWRRVIPLCLFIGGGIWLSCGGWSQAKKWFDVEREEIEHVIPTIAKKDSIDLQKERVDLIYGCPRAEVRLFDGEGTPVHNKIFSVPKFKDAFPDLNDVQLTAAMRHGLKSPIANREAAENATEELVYIDDNPYYETRRLNFSVPYLVPRAALLLEEISRAFIDSLITKQIPPHKLVISSVLRTEQDVRRLRRGNRNASEQSCHQYATTFDISYNHYVSMADPDDDRSDNYAVRMKSILAEVLNDQRNKGTCYVKYEEKQPCFHITCR